MGVIMPIRNPNPPEPENLILEDGSYFKTYRIGDDADHTIVVRHLTRFGGNLDAYRLTDPEAKEFAAALRVLAGERDGYSVNPASAAGGPGPSPDPTRD